MVSEELSMTPANGPEGSPSVSVPSRPRIITPAPPRVTAPPSASTEGESSSTRPQPQQQQQQSHQRRTRKAINCEPCRNSKLKCDRNKPCSSCVLRGTAAMCYLDGYDPSLYRGSSDDFNWQINPAEEIANLRRTINHLETYIFTTRQNRSSAALLRSRRQLRESSEATTTAPLIIIKREDDEDEMAGDEADPKEVSLGPENARQRRTADHHLDSAGLFSGPTSAVTQVTQFLDDEASTSSSGASRNGSPMGPHQPHSAHPQVPQDALMYPGDHTEAAPTSPVANNDWDTDLKAELPPANIIHCLVEHYFRYCNWTYRHVNEDAFRAAWNRLSANNMGGAPANAVAASEDRVTLSTLAVILAVATAYLPEDHDWRGPHQGGGNWQHLRGLVFGNESTAAMGMRMFDVSSAALQRHQEWLRGEGKTAVVDRGYTLELIELMLIRCHFMTLSKQESESIWALRGELVNIAVAMGLHHDPAEAKKTSSTVPRASTKEEDERRRWAWWHVILLERWQAFMFGRPIAIAPHHYNTRLPSHCPPNVDPTGQLYAPNIALFRLAHILGEIMDSAVSALPVPYSRIEQHDRSLCGWIRLLPDELDMDDYRLSRALAPNASASMRRLGVMSIIVRTSCNHIRFTLHRPHAQLRGGRMQSRETAISAASELISLIAHTRESLAPAGPGIHVPGHLGWGPFHVYSSALFFAFQLIAGPNEPGANLLRVHLQRARRVLSEEAAHRVQRRLDGAMGISAETEPNGDDTAGRACQMLRALEPLYMNTQAARDEVERRRIFRLVKKYAFPYQDVGQVQYLAAALASSTSSAGASPEESASATAEHPPEGAVILTMPMQPQQHPHQGYAQQPHPPMPAPAPPTYGEAMQGTGSMGSMHRSSSVASYMGESPGMHPVRQVQQVYHHPQHSHHYHPYHARGQPQHVQPPHHPPHAHAQHHHVQHQQYSPTSPVTPASPYVVHGQYPGERSSVTWGAGVPVENAEWTGFVDGMMRGPTASGSGSGSHYRMIG